jgi:hypothetical protein
VGKKNGDRRGVSARYIVTQKRTAQANRRAAGEQGELANSHPNLNELFS